MALKILWPERTFRDRVEAGSLLGEALKGTVAPGALALGIPRGGVVVAERIAAALDADLDVVLCGKLRAPFNPELAVGAVMEGNVTHLNEDIVSGLRVDDPYLQAEVRRASAELARRMQQYRLARPMAVREGRRLIVADDGVATGATMIATLEGLRAAKPASLTCALPVGPRDSLEAIAEIADEVICLCCPRWFQAVGQFYVNFDQTPDEVVIGILKNASARG